MDETLTAAPAVEDPDAELVRLEAELMASIGPTEAAGRAHAAVEEAMFAWKAANPMPTGRAAVEEWEKAKDAAKRACRYGEVEAAFLALIQKQDTLLDEMADTRATTLRGLQIKARLATHPTRASMATLRGRSLRTFWRWGAPRTIRSSPRSSGIGRP